MNEAGLEFAEALAEAKREGYAEADDSLDVDGHDAAHKAAVLAALAYGFWVPPDKLYTEGLRAVEKQDIVYARKLGYGLKLLAIIKTDPDGAVEVRVHPTLIPQSHVLASVSGVFNAVLVRGDVVGDTLYYGRGAGGDPTASAVLSDLAQIASHFPQEQKARNVGHEALHSRLKTMDEIVSRYYLRLTGGGPARRAGRRRPRAGLAPDRHFLGHPARGACGRDHAAGPHAARRARVAIPGRGGGDRRDRRGQGAAGPLARGGFRIGFDFTPHSA